MSTYERDPITGNLTGIAGTGHNYNVEASADKAHMNLMEDRDVKTTLPLVSTFVGTQSAWNNLSEAEQANYRIVNITDDSFDAVNRSYVGMIIHSTTLDTEAKVIDFYGGTTWILHDGYILRGASTGVNDNSAVADGGQNSVTPSGTISGGAVQSHTLTVNEMPSHNHGIYLRRGEPQSDPSGYNGYAWHQDTISKYTENTGGGQGHTHGFTQPTFLGTEHTNIPSYKNVYIWEGTL